MADVHFTLNGVPVTYKNPGDCLLDVLRDTFECTSVKCGCREGACGACAVLLDGRLVNACCTRMGALEGRSVVTLEGYRETKRFAALSRAFAAVSAVQCGFCTPGMILAAEALLSENPHPTEDEILTGLSGNLCRCTGYHTIIRAIDSAAREGAGLW